MTDNKEQNVTVEAEAVEAPKAEAVRSPRREFTKNRRSPKRETRERVRPEYDQKIIQIRRVTRVTSGGRRMAFSVAMALGDKKGKIGIGTGKGIDTQIAIDKAMKSAKKNMITIPLTKDSSIPHDVYTKYSSARVRLTPAPARGLVAGSAVRSILELAGITNINAKILSPSKNKMNIAVATIQALSMLKGKKVKIDIA